MSGIAFDDLLAAQLQHDAQDAVRAGMLRAEVEEHEIVGAVARRQSPALGLEAQRRLLLLDARFGHLKRAHLGGPRRMVLAQRVARPGRGQQDSRQVRVSSEDDPEHVPHFALVPVRGRPEVGDRRERRVVLVERHLDAHVSISVIRQQVVHHGEIVRRTVAAIGADPLVDCRQVVEHAVAECLA